MSSAASMAGHSQPGASQIITVSDSRGISPEASRELCAALEAGHIVFFPKIPFEISAAERQTLLDQKQTSAAYHKNVAYRPAEDRVTGLGKSESAEAEQLRAILKNYSRSAAILLDATLLPYAGKWTLDYASYRPLEERGRPARLHARNDLCHVDAFPTRPTNGDRILRLFTNVNPAQSRVWLTAETFETAGPRFAKSIGLPKAPAKDPFSRAARALGRALRIPAARRSPYDDFMHRCHNAMKEDSAFQKDSPKQRWEFPPDSTWIVFTDCVAHAVLEGQYALEQTFIVSRSAMVAPERSPVAILERIAGHPLTL
jgi:hypothetical protein